MDQSEVSNDSNLKNDRSRCRGSVDSRHRGTHNRCCRPAKCHVKASSTDRSPSHEQPLHVTQSVQQEDLDNMLKQYILSATGEVGCLIRLPATLHVYACCSCLRGTFQYAKWARNGRAGIFSTCHGSVNAVIPHLARVCLDLGTVSTLDGIDTDRRLSTTHHYGGGRTFALNGSSGDKVILRSMAGFKGYVDLTFGISVMTFK